MKFKVYFTLQNKTMKELKEEAPANNDNPIEYTNLASLLAYLSKNLPGGSLVETVGVRVETVED